MVQRLDGAYLSQQTAPDSCTTALSFTDYCVAGLAYISSGVAFSSSQLCIPSLSIQEDTEAFGWFCCSKIQLILPSTLPKAVLLLLKRTPPLSAHKQEAENVDSWIWYLTVVFLWSLLLVLLTYREESQTIMGTHLMKKIKYAS